MRTTPGSFLLMLVLALSLAALPLAAAASLRTGADERANGTLSLAADRVALAEMGLRLTSDESLAQMDMESARTYVARSEPSEKNPMVALLLSCVVPGLGEIYAGETSRGRWFMASEAAVWVGYGAFKLQEDMRRDDYTEYAHRFAGVSEGAGSDYLSDIGTYVRSEGDDSYNQAIREDARSLFPDDLDAQHEYLAEHGYFGDQSWDWGSRDRFYEYRELRNAASESERYAFYMTGLAVLNRALSAIDSAWMARRHNAGIDQEPAARISVVPQFENGEVGGRATLEVTF
jgi:hypothetical protein